ncbi:ATP-binding protein [Streptomyces sp. AK04-3B]|uniref:ATP-binding protein n=1 Tax=Streptomyces sp. AK04-3B TaxID=3028650 RepID=UPI0029A08C9E|nr:ATP-binding protein [Streptomyces sp. AK04-3B]
MSGCDAHGPRFRCVLPFEAGPAEVRLLRRATVTQLGQWGLASVAEEAELLVTELVTNVIKHVGGGVSATLILEWRLECLRVEVHDKSRTLPAPVQARSDEECGRGLHLLAALAADWGTVLTAVGKSVWCEIAVQPAVCQRVERACGALERYRESRPSMAARGRSKAVFLEESAVGLIADLLHWAAAQGHDPDDVLDRAQMRYEAESEADAAAAA